MGKQADGQRKIFATAFFNEVYQPCTDNAARGKRVMKMSKSANAHDDSDDIPFIKQSRTNETGTRKRKL